MHPETRILEKNIGLPKLPHSIMTSFKSISGVSHFWSSANNSIRSLRRMLITSFKVEHSLRSATRSPTNSRKDVAPSKEAIYVSSNYCPSFIFYSESESDPGE